MQPNMEALLMEIGGTFLRKKLLGFYELAPEDLATTPSGRRHLAGSSSQPLPQQVSVLPAVARSQLQHFFTALNSDCVGALRCQNTYLILQRTAMKT